MLDRPQVYPVSRSTEMLRLYYKIKPYLPRTLQLCVRRQVMMWKLRKYAHMWPIDPRSSRKPDKWQGWPEGKKFALVLTHDVETARGQQKCGQLMDIEKRLHFRSSFNFVPQDYEDSPDLRKQLTEEGFEVGVHGLSHDGKLYESHDIFRIHVKIINNLLSQWQSVGFRSPSMHHPLEWLHELSIEYDASTFDTDPFEPQPDGAGTIFPFWVKADLDGSGYIELPYTLAQDFTIFILMKETTIDLWKRKLDWIASQGGMALCITHPDYMNFSGGPPAREEYPSRHYEDLLRYVKMRYPGEYWHALPRDVARFWRGQVVQKETVS